MKTNMISFSFIVKFVKKYKYIFFGIIVLIAFLLMNRTYLEGFETIGRYEYLAPIPPGNTISDVTYNEFSKVYIEVKCKNLAKGQTCNSNFTPKKSEFEKIVTEKEMQYYITNKKWPWGSYVMELFTNNINNTKARILIERGEIKDPVLQKDTSVILNELREDNFTSRIAYGFMVDISSRPNSPAASLIDKDSLGYKIFMGTAQPPIEQVSNPNPTYNENKYTQCYEKCSNLCKSISVS